MGTVHNSDTVEQVIRAAGVQTATEMPPRTLSNQIVPVMEVNPRLVKSLNIIRSGSLSNATSATVHTCHSTKETYLWAAQLTSVKDVTATTAGQAMKVTPFGDNTARNILTISALTLTAESPSSASIALFKPIRLKAGSTITITATTATGNVNVNGNVILEEVEPQ